MEDENLVPSWRRRRPPPRPDTGDRPVAALIEHGLAVRTVNSLEAENIIMMSALLRMSAEELFAVKNLGVTAFAEMVRAVRSAGYAPPKGWRASVRR